MYLLDTNIFIEAKNRYYGFDIAPGFWEWIDRGTQSGVVCSIVQVKDEMAAGTDSLATWAKERVALFLPMDAATLALLPQLSSWATAQAFTQAAVAEFLSVADYYLVAFAAAHGHTIVTHEIATPNSRARVMIPDACVAMGVSYCNPFTMLRNERAEFVLA